MWFTRLSERLTLLLVMFGRNRERKIIVSILSRIAALEAAQASQASTIADLAHPTQGIATQADLSALSDRVSNIETEIGSEAPAAQAQ